MKGNAWKAPCRTNVSSGGSSLIKKECNNFFPIFIPKCVTTISRFCPEGTRAFSPRLQPGDSKHPNHQSPEGTTAMRTPSQNQRIQTAPICSLGAFTASQRPSSLRDFRRLGWTSFPRLKPGAICHSPFGTRTRPRFIQKSVSK